MKKTKLTIRIDPELKFDFARAAKSEAMDFSSWARRTLKREADRIISRQYRQQIYVVNTKEKAPDRGQAAEG